MPLSTGEKLGPYEITALIGKGGMGEVYRAHDSGLRRDVAIKVSNSSSPSASRARRAPSAS
jgi:serine/threonine protein kinase